MNRQRLRANLGPCLGLIVAPLLWSVATQLGLILPYADCGAAFTPSLWMSLVCVALTLSSAAASWRVGRNLGAVSVYPRIHPFVRSLSALFALSIAFSLALQALASATISGCER